MDARVRAPSVGLTAAAPRESPRRAYCYFAYGLRIGSDVELPDLVSAARGGDVDIRYEHVEPVPDPADGSPLWWSADPGHARITYPPVGSFLVRAGREIVVDPAIEADPRVVRQVVIGPALAVLLTQRGLSTLHASAVEIGGRGVIFVGGSGSGKSTTAAALNRRGHPLIADDAVAFAGSHGSPMLPPGFPRLKLWPETATSLGIDSGDLMELYPALEKLGLPVREGFAQGPVPPTHVYVLADGPKVAIESLSPAESVIELIRHAHGVMSMQGIDPSDQLRRTARLATCVSVRRLRRPLTLEGLAEVAEAVETDVTI